VVAGSVVEIQRSVIVVGFGITMRPGMPVEYDVVKRVILPFVPSQDAAERAAESNRQSRERRVFMCPRIVHPV
jgi:hypothetical protein